MIEFPTLVYENTYGTCTFSPTITYTSTSADLKNAVDAIGGLSLTVNGADGDSSKPTLSLTKDSATYTGAVGSSRTFTVDLT